MAPRRSGGSGRQNQAPKGCRRCLSLPPVASRPEPTRLPLLCGSHRLDDAARKERGQSEGHGDHQNDAEIVALPDRKTVRLLAHGLAAERSGEGRSGKQQQHRRRQGEREPQAAPYGRKSEKGTEECSVRSLPILTPHEHLHGNPTAATRGGYKWYNIR
jgi:hypothetical protein